ncbi:zinc finger protein 212-like [Phyllostomus hastatus]|uniref:zinc finger protein 212-like n=1 Tax=Phyllostomus hastatus TaxID=9423 RepID=UPI001E683E6F|nr:zinc finger protein 212-like [Phyllostomus hastatus]
MLGDLKEEGFAGACPRECSEDLPGAFSGTAKEQALLALQQTELWGSQGSSVLLDSDPRDTNAEEPTEGSRDPGSDRGLGCPLKQKFNRQVQLGQECGHGLKLEKDTSVSYEPSECKISFRCEEQLATYLRTHSGWESLSASELEDSLRRRSQLKPQSTRTNQNQCEACMRNFSCRVSLVTHQHCHLQEGIGGVHHVQETFLPNKLVALSSHMP